MRPRYPNFPRIFLRVSLKNSKSKGCSIVKDQLTDHSSFNLFCHKGKNPKNLSHDIHNGICHFYSRWESDVNFKSSEKTCDSVKEVEQSALASANRLMDLTVKIAPGKKK